MDKLGSLVARVVLAPLEHSAYLFFSANLRRDVPIEKQQQVIIRFDILCQLSDVLFYANEMLRTFLK